MSERQDFKAGQEARRQVVDEGGREGRAGFRLDAVLRYLKGAGTGKSGTTGREKPLSGRELRRRIVDRVIDAGGEVTSVVAAGDTVLVRGRIGLRSEIAMLDRELRQIPGVSRLELHFTYDVDDTAPPAGPGMA